eukprot:7363839-Alexandrium_andersonii.AAC.1
MEPPKPRGLVREPPGLAVEEHAEPFQRAHPQMVRMQPDCAPVALLREAPGGRHCVGLRAAEDEEVVH